MFLMFNIDTNFLADLTCSQILCYGCIIYIKIEIQKNCSYVLNIFWGLYTSLVCWCNNHCGMKYDNFNILIGYFYAAAKIKFYDLQCLRIITDLILSQS